LPKLTCRLLLAVWLLAARAAAGPVEDDARILERKSDKGVVVH
jgi:hypothetical protein